MEPLERKRYIRQIILPEMGLDGQQKLKAARVLVIGAGGLGCPLLQYLTAAGVGTIGIVDNDTVDVTNLHRQILYSPADVGKNKALVAAEKLSVMNPFVKLTAIPLRLEESNATDLFTGYDVIVDGSDNFPTRYLANDICVQMNKPLVFGSILRFEGQVSVFNYNGGPTYRCLFPEAEDGDNCEVAGVLGILPGIIGSYMANEVVKIICSIGETLSGKLLVINTLHNSSNIFSFDRVTPQTSQIHATPAPAIASDPNELTFSDYEARLSVSPEQLLFIDVREEYEFEEDFLDGINIPLPDLPEKIADLPSQKTIVFYCRSGARSKMAAKLVQGRNFTGEVYWMKEE
jgi:molybdopterin/thiamine biosynthesis adenylyltransferase/rhodanese-related sulfurtransferase